jgi:hypothetical protein
MKSICDEMGRAVAQAVSRRPLTAEARVRSRVVPCGICGGRSVTGTGFSPSSTGPPLKWKSRKILIIIIFFTGLHNKPEGCGASVASAVGSFSKTNG